jgi:hypothetical protein
LEATGDDRMGAGRGKGLFKPKNTPSCAATGPTGCFLGGLVTVKVGSFTEVPRRGVLGRSPSLFVPRNSSVRGYRGSAGTP